MSNYKIMVVSSDTKSLLIFRKEMMVNWVGKGYDVIALGNEPELNWTDKFSEIGISYASYFVKRTSKNPISDLKTFFSLRSLINEIKPDIIFSYQLKSVIYTGLCLKKKGAIKYFPLMSGLGSMIRGKNNLISKLIFTQLKISLKRADKVFFHNNDDMNLFYTNKIISVNQGFVINGSGVDTNKYYSNEYPKKLTFSFIGRLLKDKGIKEFLLAADIVKKEYPDVIFKVVGDFDSNPSCISREEIEHYTNSGIIEYQGYRTNIINEIKDTSVLVLPSYHEGRPKVVLEAMSMGRAIIVSDAPGCRESIIDNVHGFIIEVNNYEHLKSALMSYVKNPSIVELFGLESRKYAVKYYDVRKVIESINKIIF